MQDSNPANTPLPEKYELMANTGESNGHNINLLSVPSYISCWEQDLTLLLL